MRLFFIFITLFFIPFHPLWAQKAKYTQAIMDEDMYIAGTVGNNIHAWSISKKNKGIFKEISQLTLHVFSSDMVQVYEKTISLGELAVTKIDFQMEQSFYFIKVDCSSPAQITKKLLYKIDATGNVSNVTDTPELLIKTHYYSSSPSTAINSNNIFTGKILPSVTDSNNSMAEASLPPGEKYDSKLSYQELALRKINIDKQRIEVEKQYASGYLNFSRLVLTATDSTVFACAFAQATKANDKNPYKGPYLFVARMDTSLIEPTSGAILLQNKKWPDEVQFIPTAIYSLNKTLLILSTVLYSKSNIAYNPLGRAETARTNNSTYLDYGLGRDENNSSYHQSTNDNIPLSKSDKANIFRQGNKIYVPGSILITQTDENNQLSADTIINIKEGPERLDWGNRFLLPRKEEVLLFCTHLHSPSNAGITLFSIGQHGNIKERDLIVNENYTYVLSHAVCVDSDILLVPFTYKGKAGLMKLNYGATE